jgi:hypothetical protein
LPKTSNNIIQKDWHWLPEAKRISVPPARPDITLRPGGWRADHATTLMRHARSIAALKADKSVPQAEKREGLAQLETALKNARPVQFNSKKTSRWC